MDTRQRNSRIRSRLLLGLLLLAFGTGWAATAGAQTRPASVIGGDVPFVRVLRKVIVPSLSVGKDGVQTLSPAQTQDCPGGPVIQGITCGSAASGQLAGSDCIFSDQTYYDVYSFPGTSGQTVTIDMSASFDTFLLLYTPAGGAPITFDDDSGGGPNGTNSRIVFTLTESGDWLIAASTFDANTFGSYDLSLQCSGSSATCTPSSTTLCLNNGRFRVTATFLTPQGQSGDATAVPETSDTGLFWFFSSNNIEAIIKVVNACSFTAAPRYWVFAGGLTNVQVNLTVTDTSNDTTRLYTNAQGTAFAPIQDTNAFATCP
jgi:Bacterial pre-peptidase C-terminal domain